MSCLGWKLSLLSQQGMSSCTYRGTNMVAFFLVCITLCLVSSVNASCKALMAANGKGHQSAQIVQQYIHCMRMMENSYFKRSGPPPYLSTDDTDAGTIQDQLGTILSQPDHTPYYVEDGLNIALKEDTYWPGKSNQPAAKETGLLGLILLKQPYNVLKLLKTRDAQKRSFIPGLLTPSLEDLRRK